jgi:hypothetical protein
LTSSGKSAIPVKGPLSRNVVLCFLGTAFLFAAGCGGSPHGDSTDDADGAAPEPGTAPNRGLEPAAPDGGSAHIPDMDPVGAFPPAVSPGVESTGGVQGSCDIEIAEVAIYQGVKVTLVANGAEVIERNADVIERRPALFRVFLRPGSTWQAGEAQVRLTLRSSDGANTYKARKIMTAASKDEAPTSTFNFDVPGSDIARDTRYAVEVTDPAACAARPEKTRFPAAGEAPLGARRTGTLRVRIVPVRYDSDGSGRLPDISQSQIERYQSFLTAMFPVSDVELTVRQAIGTRINVTADSGWTNLLEALRALRAQDRPPDDVYYFGLVVPASSGAQYCKSGCVAGISYRAGPHAPRLRVSLAVGYGGASSAEAMAHELGHAHGRLHAPCGMVKDPDPGYPYAGGATGVWGYDNRSPRQLFAPASKDIMSYCGPRWISDYTFRALADRSALVNVTQGAPVLAAETGPQNWRVLLLDARGTPRWGLEASGAPAGATVEADVLDARGSRLGILEAIEAEMSDTDERAIWIPVPAPFGHSVRVPGATSALPFSAESAVVPLH